MRLPWLAAEAVVTGDKDSLIRKTFELGVVSREVDI